MIFTPGNNKEAVGERGYELMKRVWDKGVMEMNLKSWEELVLIVLILFVVK